MKSNFLVDRMISLQRKRHLLVRSLQRSLKALKVNVSSARKLVFEPKNTVMVKLMLLRMVYVSYRIGILQIREVERGRK